MCSIVTNGFIIGGTVACVSILNGAARGQSGRKSRLGRPVKVAVMREMFK
jgi:hypothetical protein